MCILIYFLDDISTDMNLDLNIMAPSYRSPSPVCIKTTDTVSSQCGAALLLSYLYLSHCETLMCFVASLQTCDK